MIRFYRWSIGRICTAVASRSRAHNQPSPHNTLITGYYLVRTRGGGLAFLGGNYFLCAVLRAPGGLKIVAP